MSPRPGRWPLPMSLYVAAQNHDVMFGLNKYELAIAVLCVAQVVNAIGLLLLAILGGRRR